MSSGAERQAFTHPWPNRWPLSGHREGRGTQRPLNRRSARPELAPGRPFPADVSDGPSPRGPLATVVGEGPRAHATASLALPTWPPAPLASGCRNPGWLSSRDLALREVAKG